MKSYFSIGCAIFISGWVHGKEQKEDTNKILTQVIEKDCVIKHQDWEPFSYVLETRDGMRIPLAGNFAPLDDGTKESISYVGARITIVIARYDLRPYYISKGQREWELQKKYGKRMPIAGISGIPVSDFGWFVTVSKVEHNGVTYDSHGTLEKLGVVIFNESPSAHEGK